MSREEHITTGNQRRSVYAAFFSISFEAQIHNNNDFHENRSYIKKYSHELCRRNIISIRFLGDVYTDIPNWCKSHQFSDYTSNGRGS